MKSVRVLPSRSIFNLQKALSSGWATGEKTAVNCPYALWGLFGSLFLRYCLARYDFRVCGACLPDARIQNAKLPLGQKLLDYSSQLSRLMVTDVMHGLWDPVDPAVLDRPGRCLHHLCPGLGKLRPGPRPARPGWYD